MSSEAKAFKYFAFISYSRKDSKAAAWLQKRLEWFRFPVKLVPEDRRPPHDRYVRPIYRDKTNLEVTDEHYWTNIRRALEESRYLVVLCSPHSAKSEPVNMEVAHFLETHGGDTSLVAPVIVSGNVTSTAEDAALCPALRDLGDPLINRNLPTMVPDAESAEKDGWEKGFSDLVSYLLQLDRTAIGDHIRRETKRQTKVLRCWLGAVTALGALATGALVFARHTLEQQDELLWKASKADHEAATNAFKDGRHAAGLAYLNRALDYRPKNTAALASGVGHAFGINSPRWRTRSVSAFPGPMMCVGFSPDSRYIVAGSGDFRGGKGEVRVIEAATGTEISKTVFGASVASVSFSSDGRHIVAGSEDKTARVIEAATGKEVRKVEFGARVGSVSFSPDGRYFATGSGDYRSDKGEVRVIEVATGTEITKVAFGGMVNSVSFSPDGIYIVAGSDDKTARVIEAATGMEFGNMRFGDRVDSVSFSPDGHLFAARSSKTARVVEIATGKVISNSEFNEEIESLCFSPDGRFFAVGGNDNDRTLRVIETATGKQISAVGFGGLVGTISFSPDGRNLAAGSFDNSARVIVAVNGKEISRSESGSSVTAVSVVSFSPDGRFLVVASYDNTLRVLEAANSKDINKLEFGDRVMSVSLSSNGHFLATGGDDKTVRVCETITGKEVSKSLFSQGLNSVSFSPDGRFLAACSGDIRDGKGEMRVIETATGTEIIKTIFDADVASVSFSPDGRFLAVGGADRTVRVISASTGKQISERQFDAHVASVCFSPDGRYIAAGCWDNYARVIEAVNGKEVSKLEFGYIVKSVDFSHDGRFLTAGSGDWTTRVFETTTGKEICKATSGQFVSSVRFSYDDRWVAAGSWDNTARIIEANTGKEVSQVKFGAAVNGVSFSSDGRYFAAGSNDKTVQVMDCFWFHQLDNMSAPGMAAAISMVSGLEFQADGHLRSLSDKEIIQAQDTVRTFLSHAPSDSERWQHSILKWTQMLPEERTTSPWTTEPVRVAVGRWLEQAHTDKPTIIDCAEQAPWHPLEPVSLARLELKPDDKTDAATRETMLIRPRFLARLTLKRLRAADEQLYGRDTLAEYAAWSAKIMHEELHLDIEAQEALTFALERTPPEKQKELQELKAKLESK